MMDKSVFKTLRDELIRYRAIFLKDRETNFKYNQFMTTIDCHLEDLDIMLDNVNSDKKKFLDWTVRGLSNRLSKLLNCKDFYTEKVEGTKVEFLYAINEKNEKEVVDVISPDMYDQETGEMSFYLDNNLVTINMNNLRKLEEK